MCIIVGHVVTAHFGVSPAGRLDLPMNQSPGCAEITQCRFELIRFVFASNGQLDQLSSRYCTSRGADHQPLRPPSVELEGEWTLHASVDIRPTSAKPKVSGVSCHDEDPRKRSKKPKNAPEHVPECLEQMENSGSERSYGVLMTPFAIVLITSSLHLPAHDACRSTPTGRLDCRSIRIIDCVNINEVQTLKIDASTRIIFFPGVLLKYVENGRGGF